MLSFHVPPRGPDPLSGQRAAYIGLPHAPPHHRKEDIQKTFPSIGNRVEYDAGMRERLPHTGVDGERNCVSVKRSFERIRRYEDRVRTISGYAVSFPGNPANPGTRHWKLGSTYGSSSS